MYDTSILHFKEKVYYFKRIFGDSSNKQRTDQSNIEGNIDGISSDPSANTGIESTL